MLKQCLFALVAYTHTHIATYTRKPTHTLIHSHTHTHTHTHTRTHTHTHTHTHTRTHTHTQSHLYTQIHIHIFMNANTRAHAIHILLYKLNYTHAYVRICTCLLFNKTSVFVCVSECVNRVLNLYI